MERPINIDNGGTLTDICVWDGTEFTFTKTLTTPFDLPQCLFDGITKASAEIYGRPALSELLHSTRHIRYSTTQGTTVAKSVALNTYSSGARGGLEGTRALAEAYRLGQVLMFDVGATTDAGSVRKEEILTDRRGSIVAALISIPVSDLQSSGVGGKALPVVFGFAGWALVSR
jgi:N-methylhydantoinase A